MARHRSGYISMVLLALAPCFAQGQPQSAQDVLDLARRASGAGALADIRVLRATGRETYAGLEGGWRTAQDLRDGRFSSTSDFKAYRTADVFDGAVRWRQDRSGGVHPLDAPFSRRKTRTDAWLARRGYLLPGADGAVLSLPSDRTTGGQHFIGITATPPGAEPIELWFDLESHLLVRTVRQLPLDVEVTQYGAYRAFKGMQLPFRISTANEDGTNEDSVEVERYDAAPVSDEFRRPVAPRDADLSVASTTSASANRSFVIEARVNDQGPFGFILDTGGHDILTPAALHALGLEAVGHARSGGAGEGTLDEQVVRIDKLQIGSATMRDQFFAVLPLDYGTTERDPHPPLAGIIGLELFERLIVRLDYRHGALTVLPAAQSVACRGTTVSLFWDDDMPLAHGTIDGTPGVVAVDTGNGGSTVVQGIWASQNGMASQLKRGLETVSFGAGGASRNWASLGHRVTLGDAEIADTELRYAEDRRGAFSSRTEAGNVGYNVLANFTVTFDYARREMCLEPVPGFVAPPLNRSGLRVVKTERNSFTVVQVAPNSPGASAGFREGDSIRGIDGRSAADLSYDDVFDLLRGAPGTRISFDVIRGTEKLQPLVVLEVPTQSK
jgi:hypothetical protein